MTIKFNQSHGQYLLVLSSDFQYLGFLKETLKETSEVKYSREELNVSLRHIVYY